jgi:hypothetical protein
LRNKAAALIFLFYLPPQNVHHYSTYLTAETEITQKTGHNHLPPQNVHHYSTYLTAETEITQKTGHRSLSTGLRCPCYIHH